MLNEALRALASVTRTSTQAPRRETPAFYGVAAGYIYSAYRRTQTSTTPAFPLILVKTIFPLRDDKIKRRDGMCWCGYFTTISDFMYYSLLGGQSSVENDFSRCQLCRDLISGWLPQTPNVVGSIKPAAAAARAASS